MKKAATAKYFRVLQLGPNRSVVEIDGKIKLGDNHHLAMIASWRGRDDLSKIFMQLHLREWGLL